MPIPEIIMNNTWCIKNKYSLNIKDLSMNNEIRRPCSRCDGSMIGEIQPIPKKIPLPIPLKPSLSIEKYLPNITRDYDFYTVFICSSCGYMDVYFTKTKQDSRIMR